jgi:hypothetical protein
LTPLLLLLPRPPALLLLCVAAVMLLLWRHTLEEGAVEVLQVGCRPLVMHSLVFKGVQHPLGDVVGAARTLQQLMHTQLQLLYLLPIHSTSINARLSERD